MVKDEYAISFALILNLRLMKDILSEIIANKRFEVDLQKQAISIEQLQEGINEVPASRSMKRALASSDSGIIAEFKRRSPSKGGSNRRHVPKKLFRHTLRQVLPPSLFSLMRSFWRKSERYSYSTSFGRCAHYKKRLYH